MHGFTRHGIGWVSVIMGGVGAVTARAGTLLVTGAPEPEPWWMGARFAFPAMLVELAALVLLAVVVLRMGRAVRRATAARREEIRRQHVAEKELKAERDLLALVMNTSPVGLMRLAADGRVLFMNARAEAILGVRGDFLKEGAHDAPVWPLKDMEGRAVPPEEWPFARVMREGSLRQVRYAITRPDGRPITINVSGNTMPGAEGRPAGAILAVEEITGLAEMEFRLRQSEKQYHLLFQEMTAGAAVHEILCGCEGTPVDYRFLDINPAFEAMTGISRERIVGRTVLEVMPDTEPYWIETYGRVALTGRPEHFENYSESLRRHYEVTAYSPERGKFAVIFHDVSARKLAEEQRRNLEKQLLQTQKLESLGVLAGGIAHDFNNLLMAVLGNADLALSTLSKASPSREFLEDIETAARRAADLCRQLLAYSGKGKFIIEAVDLRQVVEEMANMLEVSISKKAVLKYRFAENVPPVEADATQIRQITMNLITNASEAIGEKSGVISVSVGVLHCDRAYLSEAYLDESLAEGLYSYIEVSDTGCGMDAETRMRLFDPFFTTKFTGRGLGLAAVLGIVRGHKGAIKVYSELGQGTTFKVLFPALSGPADVSKASTRIPAADFWRGVGLVLLVDDEESVRSVSGKMLMQTGFEVETAEDGVVALEKFRKRPEAFRCVVLDLTMPHMDGEECFREIRRLRHDIPVIMSSGYNEQDVVNRFAGKGLAGFIQKPYRTVELVEKLREVLTPADAVT